MLLADELCYLGKYKTLAFGGWPEVELANVRAKRDEARRLLAKPPPSQELEPPGKPGRFSLRRQRYELMLRRIRQQRRIQ